MFRSLAMGCLFQVLDGTWRRDTRRLPVLSGAEVKSCMLDEDLRSPDYELQQGNPAGGALASQVRDLL